MLRTWCLVTTIVLLGVIRIGHAQESIGVFSDARGCPCELTDRGSAGLLTVTILHVNSPGAKASQFSAPRPSCLNVTHLYDTPVFTTIGNSQTGVAIGYGQCLTGTFQILTITYFAQGLTPDCCYYEVLPDPSSPSGAIEVFDCNDQLVFPPGWYDIVNSTESCQCYAGFEYCYPVAVESSTWGRVKALYE